MSKVNYTHDKKFYAKIWEEREHVSELSGIHLGDEANTWFFSHILGKGAYPKFRHRKDNIILMTKEEHWDFDQNTHKAKENPLYNEVFERAEILKEEYYKNNTIILKT